MSRALLIASIVHVALATAYAVSMPVFEGPDENDHWLCAWQIANAKQLPVMRYTAKDLGRPLIDEAGLAHHPPLYYALLAGAMIASGRDDMLGTSLVNPNQMATKPGSASLTPEGVFVWLHGADEQAPVSHEVRFLHLMRFGSVLCGLGSLILAWILARIAFPGSRAVADTTAFIIATLPGWSFHHGALDNGNLATTFAHAALVVLCAAIAGRRLDVRITVACAVLLGLCLMTKLTTLTLVSMFGLVALIAVLKAQNKVRAFWAVAIAAAVLVAITGWFFVRNEQLYGDLLGRAAHERVYASNRVPEGRTLEYLEKGFFPYVFTSWLGIFGYWTVQPLPEFVTFGKVVAALAACGVAFNLLRPRGHARPAVVLVLVGAGAVVFASNFYYNLVYMQPQGRYLFPAMGPYAIALAAGLVRLVQPLRPRARVAIGVVSAASAITIALLVYEKCFVPAFDRSLVPAPALYASLVEGCAARSTSPGIAIQEPPAAARLDAAPTLRWQPLDDLAARYQVYVFTPAGRIVLATHEWLHVELEGGSFTIPDVAWDSFPLDVELIWNVRRIADRTKHERPRDMPTGAGRAFVRVK